MLQPNTYLIMQLKDTQDPTSDNAVKVFKTSKELKEIGFEPDAADYEPVYSGKIEYPDDDLMWIVNDIYCEINLLTPDDYVGRTIDVSDVLALNLNGEVRAFYIEDAGYTELDGFLPEYQ